MHMYTYIYIYIERYQRLSIYHKYIFILVAAEVHADRCHSLLAVRQQGELDDGAGRDSARAFASAGPKRRMT